MTASRLPPLQPLTVAEYAALGEDEHGRTELTEGSLVMSPSPTADHQVAIFRLAAQLTPRRRRSSRSSRASTSTSS